MATCPKKQYPKLFTYLDGREIVLNYDAENPFRVEQVAILFDSQYNTYAVFECGLMFHTDLEVKEFGKNFAQELLNVLRKYT